jgi:hypothetical protein
MFKKFILFGVISLFPITESQIAAASQKPDAPTNLTSVGGNGEVVLMWNAVSNATSYNLYLSRFPGINNENYTTRAGMKISNVNPLDEITGLNNGITYYFVVTSENQNGESSPSNQVSAVPDSLLNNRISFEDYTTVAGLSQNRAPAFGNPLWCDINNDGYLDIIDPHHQRTISVYLNNHYETFHDITSDSGIRYTNEYDRHGIAVGDYNNDGNLDFFIALGSASGSAFKNSQLWKGDGTGRFTDNASEAGINILTTRDCAWVDHDNDGHLDLFVAYTGGDGNGVVYKNDGNGFFEDVTSLTGLEGAFNMVLSFVDYNNDGYMDFFSCGRGEDKLYMNNGNGTFTKNSSFQGGHNGRGVAWGDYNNDGFIDLFVARGLNDYHRALYWDSSRIDFSFTQYPDPPETGELTFTCELATSITFKLRMSGISQTPVYIGYQKEQPPKGQFTLNSDTVTGQPQIDAGNEDGFFVWRDEDAIWHIQWTKSKGRPGFSGHITSDGQFSGVETHADSIWITNYKCSLYRNNGDGTFTDVTEVSGTGHIGNNNGVTWGDFDNDGFLDLYVVDAGDVLGNRINTLYHNKGNGTFEDITLNSRVDAINATGRHYGVASGDYNNDGLLDLLLSNGYGWGYPLANGRSILYKNTEMTNKSWIKLQLVGTKSNRSGIGAMILINTADGIQSRQLNGTGGEFYSQGLAPIHFGLGNINVIDSITVYWPSGIVQKLDNISANQEITIIESVQEEWTEPDALALWKVGDNGTEPVIDTENYIAGTASIKTTKNAEGRVTLTLQLNEQFHSALSLNPNNTSLHFQVYVSDQVTFGDIRFFAPNWENRFLYRNPVVLTGGEWTTFDINLSDFEYEAGSPNWDEVKTMRIVFWGSNFPVEINIDELYFKTQG